MSTTKKRGRPSLGHVQYRRWVHPDMIPMLDHIISEKKASWDVFNPTARFVENMKEMDSQVVEVPKMGVNVSAGWQPKTLMAVFAEKEVTPIVIHAPDPAMILKAEKESTGMGMNVAFVPDQSLAGLRDNRAPLLRPSQKKK